MSPTLFTGLFKSLPGLRCDRFDKLEGSNGFAPGDQFFLSHCHTDHMQGFDCLANFLLKKSQLPRINNKLYCSRISRSFVLSKYPLIPAKMIVDLVPNEPKTVHVYDSNEIYKLKVTALPSNHCPGSIMFLFERLDNERVVQRILYTGDFRFEPPCDNLSTLTALHDHENNPVHLDEMYLDTTFCSKKYLTFPTRQEAMDVIWELCQKWIRKNGMFKQTRSKHVILFHLPAQYGYEAILQHVYEKSLSKWRVHVDPGKWKEYLCNEELSGCTDPDPGHAQWIHACSPGRANNPLLKNLPCQAGEFEVCQIRPSAQYFTQETVAKLGPEMEDKVVSVSQGGSNYRVCFSCHSSLTELDKFVSYFKPIQITPCSVPKDSTKEEVGGILAGFQEKYREELMSSHQNSVKDSLGDLQHVEELSPHKYAPQENTSNSNSDKYDPDHWACPGSAPRRMKRPLENSSDDYPIKSLKVETPLSPFRISFDDTLDFEGKDGLNSSDEEEDVNLVDLPEVPKTDSSSSATDMKRKNFAKNRLNFYSMPAPRDSDWSSPKGRHSSMPPNFKIPIIKVTPSSPTQDPNDPEYPEYYEGKLYKYCLFKSICEDESGDVAIIAAENSKAKGNNGEAISPIKSLITEEENGASSESYSSRTPETINESSSPNDSLSIVYESLAHSEICINESSDAQKLDEDELGDLEDTPDICVQMEIAEKRQMSVNVMDNIKKVAEICDNVVTLD